MYSANNPNEEILRLRAENEKLRAENETHREIAVRETMNVATLRAALKRLHDAASELSEDVRMTRVETFNWHEELDNAAAALEEVGDE